MSLITGSRLGSYEIVSAIGAGGMGEVFRARDTKLQRDVALKILPDAFANDPDRFARFTREAQTLASLNHPNIAHIHGFEDSSGVRALVMELVEGEDLAQRIARGPIPIDEALPIARQIAEALDAAHEQGIIHRDLKPANIKLRADGAVKVLDFGLAKAIEARAPSSGMSQSPTLMSPAMMTGAGVILGTAAYMAPEQARGKAVDKRADIWAFGCVLFEMLTGMRPFPGDEVSDTLAAVLRADIEWSALPSGTPPDLARLVRRCLERDVRNRLHDIADARITLDEIAANPHAHAATADSKQGRSWKTGLTIAAVASALLVGAAVGRGGAPPAAATPSGDPIRVVIAAPTGVTNMLTPALSPDGRFVAFVTKGSGKNQIQIQRFDEIAPRVLAGTEGAVQPFVSHDAKWIAFRRGGHLERVAVEGSEPITIGDIPSDAPGASWGADGNIVLARNWYSGLEIVPASGGAPRPLTALNTGRNEKGHWFPHFLPDGRHVLFTIWYAATGLNDSEIAVLDVATGTYRSIVPGAMAYYVAPGTLIFYRAGAYQAIRFDATTMTTSGDAVRVFDDAKGNTPDGTVPPLVASASGAVAYIPGRYYPEQSLAWVTADGRLEPLPFAERSYGPFSISPDGRRAAAGSLEAGRWILRILDFDRRTDDPVELPGSNWQPQWHPDGHHLAFISMPKGAYDIYWKDLNSSAAAAQLFATERDEAPTAWLPDGRSLVINATDVDGKYRTKLLNLDDPSRIRVLSEYAAFDGTPVSPDGRSVAMIDDHTGRSEVYVRSVTGEGTAERVSSNGADGIGGWASARELYYLRVPDIMLVTGHDDGGRFRVDSERVWARADSLGSGSTLQIAPKGRVFVTLPKNVPPPQIRVVLGWDKELAQKFNPK